MKTMYRVQLTAPITAMLVTFFLSISCISLVFSQARIVKDMNLRESPFFIEYSQLTRAEDCFYFVSRGKELWKSDGTRSGTRRLKAIRSIENLTLIGNSLYFAGGDVNGSELWKSDGTAQGTVRIKDIRRGVNSSAPKSFTNVNGTIYFVADNGTGFELWKTNGTSSGTVLVKDIWSGPSGSEPSYLTKMNSTLYFSAADEHHGRELWKSDGTAASTVLVKDIHLPEGKSSDPQEIVAMNGFVFFSAYDTLGGRELWRSKGTGDQTTRLKDINPGPESSNITSIRRMGNAIYFDANNGIRGTSLWKSDGTSGGTRMLKDITSDNANNGIDDMTVINNRLYWLHTIRDDHQVWVSNGTAAGTRYVTTFRNRITAAQFTFMNNRIFYFSGFFDHEVSNFVTQIASINPDGTDWREVWKMPMPFNFDDNLQYDFSLELITFKNMLYFPGVRNEQEGYVLLKSAGNTAAPTLLVNTFKPTLSSNPTDFQKNMTGTFFVTRNNAWEEPHLWHTDGTSAGTIHLKTLPWLAKSTSTDNKLFFFGSSDMNQWHLWSSDGTPSGTIPVKEIPSPGQVQRMLTAGTRIYFSTEETALWTSDGTANGTIHLKTFPLIEHLAPSGNGNGIYILARSPIGGQELWKSNGTAEGTTRVKVIRNSNGQFTGSSSASLGNIFYFLANDGIHGMELWRSDGTATGTFMVKDIRKEEPGERLVDIGYIVGFKDAVYVNAWDAGGEFSLFVSDGTNAGTKEIYDSQQIISFLPHNDRLLFISVGPNGYRLSSTDGTPAGTTFLAELTEARWPVVSSVKLNDITYFAFQEFDGSFGADSLWRTDGTACGTFGIDIGLNDVANVSTIGSELLLTGFHLDYGTELFKYDPHAAPTAPCVELDSQRQNASVIAGRLDETSTVLYAPNPFKQNFSLTITSERNSVADVAILDLAGNHILSKRLETNKTHELGDDWSEGLYIVRIVFDGRVSFQRLIKERP